MKNEIVVNIKDMLLSILLKWRQILICMVIFMVVLDGAAVYKSYGEVQIAKEKQKVASKGGKISYDDVTAELSESEIKEAEYRFKAYKDYLNKYKKLTDYSEKSLLMNLDPNHLYKGIITYVVSDKEHKDDVESYLKAKLSNNSVYKEFVNDNNYDSSKSYVSELVQVGSIKSTEKDLGQLKSDNANNTIQIFVLANTKDQVEALENIVEKKVSDVSKNIKENYANTVVTKVGDTVSLASDETVLKKQTNVSDEIDTINNSIANNLNNMDEGAKNYYKAMVENLSVDENDNIIYVDSTDGVVSNKSNKKVEIEIPSVQFVNKKYIVLGAALGLFIALIVYALKYLLSRKLKASEELKDSFGMTVIGNIMVNPKRNSKIDNKIMEIFGKKMLPMEKALKNINKKCVALAKKQDIDSVIFINNEDVDLTSYIQKDMFEGIKINFMTDEELIDEAATSSKSQTVIMTVIAGSTSYKDIDDSMELYEKLDIKLLGGIVLE